MSPILSTADAPADSRRATLVGAGRKFSDLAIANRAAFCLQSHPHFRGRDQWVQCQCRDGILILRGKLPSFYLKQLAQEALSRIAGVAQIDNQIVVSSPVGFVSGDASCRSSPEKYWRG